MTFPRPALLILCGAFLLSAAILTDAAAAPVRRAPRTPSETRTMTLTRTSSGTWTRTLTPTRSETVTVTETPTVTPTHRIIEVDWFDTSPLILESGGARLSYSLLSWAEEASITVAAPSGVLVWSLDPAPGGPGSHEVSWNGRDRMGRPVSNGTYLAVLRIRRADVAIEVSRPVEIRRFQPGRNRNSAGGDPYQKGE